jgi:hypothetical protein
MSLRDAGDHSKRQALTALGVSQTEKSNALARFRGSALKGRRSVEDSEVVRIEHDIIKNPRRVLSEIREKVKWSRRGGIAAAFPLSEWLRPAWQAARISYIELSIVELAEKMRFAKDFENASIRQGEAANALREVARAARNILSWIKKDDVVHLMQEAIGFEFIPPAVKTEHNDGSVTIAFPPPKLRLTNPASARRGPDSEYLPAEQTLHALWPKALICALEDLQRLAAQRAKDDDLRDVGSPTKKVCHVRRPPAKRWISIECVGLLWAALGRFPRPKVVKELVIPVADLAGFDNEEGFDEQVKEAVRICRPGNSARSWPDELARSIACQHLITLADPFVT